MIKVIIILGFLANLAAYGNFFSTILFLVVWGLSNLSIEFFFSKEDNSTAKELNILIISLMYFFSGLIELQIVFDNPYTVGIDADLFFKKASDPGWNFRSFIDEPLSSGFSSERVLGFKEDFLPILIWNKIYTFLYKFGLSEGRYIGIAVNTIFLVWTALIGLSILKSVKALNNKTSENFYKFLFCSSGIFWMYGSVHLRESIITLIISILLKVWIDWIHKKSFFNLIKLGIVSTSFYFTANFIRGGYQNILLIFIVSFLILELYKIILERKIRVGQFVFLIILALALVVRFQNFSELYLGFQERFLTYNDISRGESSADSIGIILMDQPIIIRILLSGFLLLIAPIPFWAGQETSFSFYHFFKSSFAIYNYFTIPLLVIVIKESIKNFNKIDLDKLFLLSLLFQIMVFIGLTSIDSRHFGNFGIIYILLICNINFKSKIVREEYKYLLGIMFLLIFFLYLVYVILKFESIYLSLIFILVPLIISFFLSKEIKSLK